MKKQNVAYSHNEILLSNKKEWTAIYTTWINFKSMLLSDRQTQKTTYHVISFTWNSRKDKNIVTESKSVVAWTRGWVEWLTAKGHERTFWGYENILHLDCDGGYNTDCIHLSLNCTPKIGEFFVYKSYLNNADWKKSTTKENGKQ